MRQRGHRSQVSREEKHEGVEAGGQVGGGWTGNAGKGQGLLEPEEWRVSQSDGRQWAGTGMGASDTGHNHGVAPGARTESWGRGSQETESLSLKVCLDAHQPWQEHQGLEREGGWAEGNNQRCPGTRGPCGQRDDELTGLRAGVEGGGDGRAGNSEEDGLTHAAGAACWRECRYNLHSSTCR